MKLGFYYNCITANTIKVVCLISEQKKLTHLRNNCRMQETVQKSVHEHWKLGTTLAWTRSVLVGCASDRYHRRIRVLRAQSRAFQVVRLLVVKATNFELNGDLMSCLLEWFLVALCIHMEIVGGENCGSLIGF